MAREVCGLTHKEIGEYFGLGAFAVSKAIARAAQRMAMDRRRAEEVRALITRIQT